MWLEGSDPAAAVADLVANVFGRSLQFHAERGRIVQGSPTGVWWYYGLSFPRGELRKIVAETARSGLPGVEVGDDFVTEVIRIMQTDERLRATVKHPNKRAVRKAERAERRRRREAGELPDPDRPSITMPLDTRTKNT